MSPGPASPSVGSVISCTGCGSCVHGGQDVFTSGGEIVDRAGFDIGARSGNPSGADKAWTVPPGSPALPEYHMWMVFPCTLVVFTVRRSPVMTVPSRITHARSLTGVCCTTSCRAGASSASTPMTSSRSWYAVEWETPWSRPNLAGSVRSRNHRSANTACQKQVSDRVPARVPRRRLSHCNSPATWQASSRDTSRLAR